MTPSITPLSAGCFAQTLFYVQVIKARFFCNGRGPGSGGQCGWDSFFYLGAF